jgi:hypothetical protein
MGRPCSMNTERRYSYNILVGKNRGKKSFGGSRRRWEDNIKVNRTKIVCDIVEWIRMAQDRVE